MGDLENMLLGGREWDLQDRIVLAWAMCDGDTMQEFIDWTRMNQKSAMSLKKRALILRFRCQIVEAIFCVIWLCLGYYICRYTALCWL